MTVPHKVEYPTPSGAILRRQELARMRCRGEHCSPVPGVCCKFRIVGDDALGVPLGGILLYFFVSLMLNYSGGDIIVKFSNNLTGKKYRDVVFLQSRNCAAPLHGLC
ncbi:hypothetical protein DXA02_05530 [Ruminococcus sp. AM54-1NS]|nr:hypothetical protein DXA02_05530 [Ruminococcus sp. AM54-1NS]